MKIQCGVRGLLLTTFLVGVLLVAAFPHLLIGDRLFFTVVSLEATAEGINWKASQWQTAASRSIVLEPTHRGRITMGNGPFNWGKEKRSGGCHIDRAGEVGLDKTFFQSALKATPGRTYVLEKGDQIVLYEFTHPRTGEQLWGIVRFE